LNPEAAALDADALDEGRRLFAQECRFIAGGAAFEQLPPSDAPEVAFIGRSNAGKSSLINALVGRKSLARVSNSPGRTRQVNLFQLGGRIILADLPGYGFAQVSRADRRSWEELISAYLAGRPGLRRVCLLLDARRGAGPADLAMMDQLDRAAVAYQAVLTKTDKLTADELARARADAAKAVAGRAAAHPRVHATSARSGGGLGDLRAEIALLARPHLARE
jgi:GTP-binding protein